MSTPRIAIIGAGNVGHAMAGHLALQGYPVTLYNRWEAELTAIREAGGIHLQQEVNGFAVPELVTTDIAAAVDGAELVVITVPAFGHKFISGELIPHLKSGQVVLFQPGAFGDALEFQAMADAAGVTGVLVAETETSLYSCRVIGPARVNVRAIKSQVRLAALPASRTAQVLAVVEAPFKGAYKPADNILEIGLSNANPVYHCAPSLLNIGRVVAGEDWPFYEFTQTEVCRVVEEVDNERLALAAALGVRPPSFWDFLANAYGVTEGSKVERIHKAYGRGNPSRAPKSLQDRYLVEDIPFGLVPWASLGTVIGVPTPAISALAYLAGLLYAKDFAQEGRTAADLGLEGMTAQQVSDYVDG